MLATKPKLLPVLTSLRFFAALHVALHHFAFLKQRANPACYRNPVEAAFFHVLNVGYVAVSFFFLLSGFILAYTYLERAGTTGVAPKPFYVARFARLYPAYAASLIPGAHFLKDVLRASGLPIMLLYAVAKLTMLHAWLPGAARNWNDATWSLSVEALFYAVFPFLAVRIARMPRERVPMAMATALLASLAISGVHLYTTLAPGWSHRSLWAVDGLRFDALPYFFTRFPLFRLPEFVLGVLLGKHFLESAPTKTNYDLGILVSLGGLIGVMAFSSEIPMALLANTVLTPIIGVLVFCAARSEGPVSRLLSPAWLVLLGEASYSLYLIHGFTLRFYEAAVRHIGLVDENSTPFLLGYVATIIVASLLTYRLIEVPARRWIRARVGHLPSRAVAE